MPTLKQKLVFKEVVSGSTISDGMRKAGYAPSTTERTNKITRTKGWQELMNKYLPDSMLMKAAKEGLKANKKVFDPKGNIVEFEDYAVRHKYLETGLKVKGKLTDKVEVTNHDEDKHILVQILAEVQHNHIINLDGNSDKKINNPE